MDVGESQGKRIGELLLADELITSSMLEDALAYQGEHGGKIVQALRELGHLSLEDFVRFLSRQPGVASIDLSHYHIPKGMTELLPRDFVIEHEVFPIDKMGKLLTIGMACPIDDHTIRSVEQLTGLRVKPLLCSPNAISHAIRHYYDGEIPMATFHTGAEAADKTVVPPDAKEIPVDLDAALSIDDSIAPEPDSVLLDAEEKLAAGMQLEHVVSLIRKLETLPALPETVNRVRQAMDDLSVTPKDVAAYIVQDPGVSAKVLSVANSAAYGFPNRVDSIELAVALLGLRETYAIVLSSAVMNLFETSQIFDYGQYWEESMNCAAAAKIVATAFGMEKDKSLFTAALLHSMGRLAFLETVPDLYAQVPAELSTEALEAAEMRILGVASAEAGYELAIQWNLPEEIAVPIRFHGHPEFCGRHREGTAVVGIAVRWIRGLASNESKDEILAATQVLTEVLDVNSELVSQTFDTVSGLAPVRFTWEDSAATPS